VQLYPPGETVMTKAYFVAIGVLALVFSGVRAADPVIILKPPAAFEPLKRNLDITTKPNFDLQPHMQIVKFSARRASNKILIDGVVRNSSILTSDSATRAAAWTIFRAVGGKWVPVKSGQVVLKPNQQTTVSALVDSTSAERFKLDVTRKISHVRNEVKTATCAVAANVFVVMYRVPDWTTKTFIQANPATGLIGTAARNFAQRMGDLGYQTKIKYIHKHIEYFVDHDDIYTQEVSYRQVNWLERTFATEAAARAWRDRLPGGTERKLVLR
jgi:hypothetical protein